MIEYPSILSSSKAPRKLCLAFEKLDGSNIRVKYSKKKGFHLFGSRTQLFDNTHPFLSDAIPIFERDFKDKLTTLIEKNYDEHREVIAFFEFFGDKSFAGVHEINDPKKMVLIDILVGNKDRKFLLPQEFKKECDKLSISIPRLIYTGNLTDEFIKDIREGKYDVVEGVVCKGTEKSGAYRGGVWMAKVKTQKYFDALRIKFGEEGIKKYGE